MDLIDRQAAIDALSTPHGILYPIRTVEELPSAQPERTCVNCGRTANNGGWYADGRERMKMIISYIVCVTLGLVVGYILGHEDGG